MKRILFLIIFIFSSLFSNTYTAQISQIEGKVKILKKGEIKKYMAKLNDKLFKGDMIITYKNAKATIKLTDNSKISLDEKSKLLIKEKNKLFQKEGEIYYNIQKRKIKGLKVQTNFSIIGVKGTQFIIKDKKTKKQVALKEGLIGISSLDKAFKLYKTSIYDEMEAFKKEFQEHKNNEYKNFASFTSNFDLKENMMLDFDNNNVKQTNLSSDIKNDFFKFESFQK